MNNIRTAILDYAKSHSNFKFAELLCYLNNLAQISKINLSWYLRELVKENKLFKLGRGLYTSQHQNSVQYSPRLRKKAITLYKKLSSEFPYINISVFDGQVLADFQQHLSTNNAIYIEVDRDVIEAVFHYLKKSRFSIFLKPSKDFVYDYIDITQEVIIVKPLISESPLTKCDGIRTPALEKIIVDIFCDDDLDYLHGAEWFYILGNAIDQYSINRSAMLRYASRRNVKTKIEDALNKL